MKFESCAAANVIDCAVLAAWMRLKYPHIAIGALASSAPILQFEDIVPSTIFYDLVSDDFRVCILLPCAFLLFLSFFINRSTNLTHFFLCVYV